MSGGGGSRRGFLRDLIRSATQSIDAIRDASESEPTLEPSFVREGSGVPVAAPPAARLATHDELRALCGEVGLAHRAENAAALARVGVRLTPSSGGTSTIGGTPRADDDFGWPEWQDERLQFVLDVDLASLPASLPLPREGRLLLFASRHAPAGRSPDDAGAVAVRYAGDAIGAEEGVKLAPSAELVLPPEPDVLELPGDELAIWGELRARLAAAQGVELEEAADDYHALHRVLGFPDAVAEYMEVEAALVARGLDLDDDDTYAHRDAATPWTLLFQISSDADAGVELPLYERLFVWIREEDLAAGRFDDVRAFVR